MRIVSGKYGGRRFPGKAPAGVRPTSDNVRESIFNILANLIDTDGIQVLDVCAGTGALGFEALSRGAERCTFIEKNRKTANVIKEAAGYFGIPGESTRIVTADAIKAIGRLDDKYSLIFIDPPYNLNLNNGIIAAIHRNGIIEAGGIIVSEQAAGHGIVLPDFFEILKEKLFGGTKLVILKYGPPE